jgi:hypothetical protein
VKISNHRRLLALTGSTTLVLVAGWGSAAQAAPATASPAWKTSAATTNCPASVGVLTPNRSADYYQAHPDQMSQPSSKHRATATDSPVLKVLNHMATAHTKWLTSITCTPGRPGQPVLKKAPTGSVYNSSSTNWSGYQTGKKGGYLAAAMEWVVHPAVAASSTETISSIWPGIGTGNSTSDSLIQAGTHQDAACNASSCTTSYYPWFEIYPQESEQEITNLTVSPGDYVGVVVEYDPETADAYFEVDNYTTGLGVYAYQYVTGSIVGSGTQAEWIVERPTECFIICQMGKLTNFGTEPIGYAQAVYGSLWSDPNLVWSNAGTLSPDAISMYSCSGTLMSQPGAISSGTNFNVVWKSYGNWESC